MIEEYLCRAPGDFVKVYLYLLKACHHPGLEPWSIEAAAAGLRLTPEAVQNALGYWQRQGVLDRDEQGNITLSHVTHMVLTRDPVGDSLYRYRSFNQDAQLIFGTRLLDSSLFQFLYDLIEHDGFDEDAVLMLLRYCVEKKGDQVSMSYIRAAARGWKQDGCTTAAAANAKIGQSQDLSRLFRHLGFSRQPTADERSMFQQWRGEWGFTLEAILAACYEATKTDKPNMQYLGRVLDTLRRQGLTSAAAIQGQRAMREGGAPMREVLHTLGQRGSVTDRMAQQYMAWRDAGLTHELLIYAAEQSRGAANPLRYFASVIKVYQSQGITTVEGAQQQGTAAAKAAAPARKKPLNFDYEGQREYSEEELSRLYTDWDDLFDKP